MTGVALGLYAAGLAVVTGSAIAALAQRTIFARLHYLTPMTSVGGPLIGIALAIRDGWGLTAGEILLIAGLLAVTGPVLAAATARLAAQQQGLTRSEPPR